MSEYIAHIAVQADTARLVIQSSQICDAFKLCFREHAVACRMGSASRGNSTFVVQNIEHFGKLWPNRKPADRLEDKVAYTLGWITHRAADRYFKPRYGIFDKNPENLHPVDIRIYHDVVLYEKVFNNGKEDPFSVGFTEKDMRSHPASGQINVSAAEKIFGLLYQADFLSMQSFDMCTDAKSFVDRVVDQFPTFTVDFGRLTAAVSQPDALKMHQMIEAPNFYNEEDELIKIARNLQQGKSIKGMSIEEALDTEDQSQYAQTLSKSFNWIKEASKLFTGEIKDKEYLYNNFNIIERQKIERY